MKTTVWGESGFPARFLGVGDGVPVGAGVGVGVGVGSGVAVAVGAGVEVVVPVGGGAAAGVATASGVCVGVGVGTGTGVSTGAAVAVGCGSAAALNVADGADTALASTGTRVSATGAACSPPHAAKAITADRHSSSTAEAIPVPVGMPQVNFMAAFSAPGTAESMTQPVYPPDILFDSGGCLGRAVTPEFLFVRGGPAAGTRPTQC